MNNIIPFIARTFLSAIFLISGVKSALGFDDMVKALASKNIAIPEFFAAAAIAFLLVGGLMVLTGFKAKVGAFLLLVFIVPTTLLFHWDLSNQGQMTQVLKNAGLAGGLLMVIAYGVGGLSIDGWMRKEPRI